MTTDAARSSACPRADCSSSVTRATEEELRGGSPLWRCGSDHRGPRFVGFDAYAG